MEDWKLILEDSVCLCTYILYLHWWRSPWSTSYLSDIGGDEARRSQNRLDPFRWGRLPGQLGLMDHGIPHLSGLTPITLSSSCSHYGWFLSILWGKKNQSMCNEGSTILSISSLSVWVLTHHTWECSTTPWIWILKNQRTVTQIQTDKCRRNFNK